MGISCFGILATGLRYSQNVRILSFGFAFYHVATDLRQKLLECQSFQHLSKTYIPYLHFYNGYVWAHFLRLHRKTISIQEEQVRSASAEFLSSYGS